jgi:hypothetical protein
VTLVQSIKSPPHDVQMQFISRPMRYGLRSCLLSGFVGCGKFWPNLLPVVGAQVASGYYWRPISLDLNAFFNWSATRFPIPNSCSSDSQFVRQNGSTTNHTRNSIKRMFTAYGMECDDLHGSMLTRGVFKGQHHKHTRFVLNAKP